MMSSASTTVPTSAMQHVQRREGERELDVDDLQQQPDQQPCQRVAERDAEQPPEQRDGQAFGGEDAADVAGAGADAAQDADLARALEHAHRDRVDEPDHADRDDQEAEHGDRRGDLAVGVDVVAPGSTYLISVPTS